VALIGSLSSHNAKRFGELAFNFAVNGVFGNFKPVGPDVVERPALQALRNFGLPVIPP
jgi:hypothetical protein